VSVESSDVWKGFRRRRIESVLLPVLAIPTLVILSMAENSNDTTSKILMFSIVAVFFLYTFYSGWVFMKIKCPRCKKSFHYSPNTLMIYAVSKCRHCGQKVYADIEEF